jgi:hypothetical protein
MRVCVCECVCERERFCVCICVCVSLSLYVCEIVRESVCLFCLPSNCKKPKPHRESNCAMVLTALAKELRTTSTVCFIHLGKLNLLMVVRL